MAGRLPKKGISFAGWSTDIFDNDTKIDKLIKAYGWNGFAVYFYLCQRAYGGDGYFYRWGYDDCATTARKMGGGIGPGTVRETVGYCLKIGLFDKGLFDRCGILTSEDIQKRYMEAVGSCDDMNNLIAEYWLLQNDENCKGLLKLPLNQENMTDSDKKKKETKREKKKSNTKEKEIKEKKDKKIIYRARVHAGAEQVIANVITRLNELTGRHFRPDTEIAVDLLVDLLKKNYTEKQLIEVVEKKCAEWKGTKYEKYLRPSTLFGEKFDEYLNQKLTQRKDTTKFHNFEQHTYDFEELEKKLFIN